MTVNHAVGVFTGFNTMAAIGRRESRICRMAVSNKCC